MGTLEKILLTLSLALALGLAGFSLLGPGSGKRDQLQTELARLRADNRRIREENRRLALQVEALKTRRDYQEKAARDELGLLKPDEVVIRLPEQPDGGRVEDAQSKAPHPKGGGS